MTPDERRLRRKLAGLNISQSHTMKALHGTGEGGTGTRLREKLKRVTQEIEILSDQIQQLERQRTTAGRMPWPVLMAVTRTAAE